MPTNMSEWGLETLIETSLIDAGYLKGKPIDYHRAYCLDIEQLLIFLQETQPQAIACITTAYGDQLRDRLFKRISAQIKTRGIVDVLRNGIKAQKVNLTIYYKQPASELNPDAINRYRANRFSVTRQLRYSNDNKQLALDLVVFINGLPLITFELKNNVTKQPVTDAMRQYQNDRDPKEPLFQFGRCLVHFALDEELVYMTTELKGKETHLPFNKGKKSSPRLHPDSAGNLFNSNGTTSNYLWQQILTKPNLSNIVEKYAWIVEETNEDRVLRTSFELEYDQGVIVPKTTEAQQQTDNPNNPSVIRRGSKGKDLLKFAGAWVGDDLKECLQAVYDNRTEAEF